MGEKSTRPDWQPTKHPGVRVRFDPVRKHGRKPDAYYAIYYTNSQGKRKQEGLGWASAGWSEAKAAATLAEVKEAIRKGEGHQSLAEKRAAARAKREDEARQNVTFDDLWPKYLEAVTPNRAPGALRTERAHHKLWISPALGSKPLRAIAPLDLERLKKRMADAGKAPRTITYALSIVRQVFNFAARHGLFQGDNPVSKVKKPTTDNRRLRFLSHSEAEKMLGALKERSAETYRHAILSLHCGLRFGEIAALTWADVDMERGSLTLRDTKSGKTRVAFMTAAVREVFFSMPEGKPSDLVFPGRGGAQMVQVSHTFGRVVDELGLNTGLVDSRQKVVFHSLRHTFASWLVENGTDLYTVKELMGHADFKMVSRYAHLSPEHMRKAVKGLEASIKAKAEPSRKVLAFRGGE